MLFSLYIYTNKPLRILNMAMQLDEYCEKLLDEYRKLPPVQYQIGYPGNYKEQDKNTEIIATESPKSKHGLILDNS